MIARFQVAGESAPRELQQTSEQLCVNKVGQKHFKFRDASDGRLYFVKRSDDPCELQHENEAYRAFAANRVMCVPQGAMLSEEILEGHPPMSTSGAFQSTTSFSTSQQALLIPIVEGDSLGTALLNSSKERQAEIVIAAIHAIEEINSAGVFHLDLKPEHFIVKRQQETDSIAQPLVTVIDFGFSALVTSDEEFFPSNLEKAFMEPSKFRGNCLYASLFQHFALPLDDGSDLQSLCFVLADIFGQLPWHGVFGAANQKGHDPLLETCFHKISALASDVPSENPWLALSARIIDWRTSEMRLKFIAQQLMESARTFFGLSDARPLPAACSTKREEGGSPDKFKRTTLAASASSAVPASSASSPPRFSLSPPVPSPASTPTPSPTAAASSRGSSPTPRTLTPERKTRAQFFGSQLETLFFGILSGMLSDGFAGKQRVPFGPPSIIGGESKPKYEADIVFQQLDPAGLTCPVSKVLKTLGVEGAWLEWMRDHAFRAPKSEPEFGTLIAEVSGLHTFGENNAKREPKDWMRTVCYKLIQIERDVFYHLQPRAKDIKDQKGRTQLVLSALRMLRNPQLCNRFLALVLLGVKRDVSEPTPADCFAAVGDLIPHAIVLVSFGRLFVHMETKNTGILKLMEEAASICSRTPAAKTKSALASLANKYDHITMLILDELPQAFSDFREFALRDGLCLNAISKCAMDATQRGQLLNFIVSAKFSRISRLLTGDDGVLLDGLRDIALTDRQSRGSLASSPCETKEDALRFLRVVLSAKFSWFSRLLTGDERVLLGKLSDFALTDRQSRGSLASSPFETKEDALYFLRVVLSAKFSRISRLLTGDDGVLLDKLSDFALTDRQSRGSLASSPCETKEDALYFLRVVLSAKFSRISRLLTGDDGVLLDKLSDFALTDRQSRDSLASSPCETKEDALRFLRVVLSAKFNRISRLLTGDERVLLGKLSDFALTDRQSRDSLASSPFETKEDALYFLRVMLELKS